MKIGRNDKCPCKSGKKYKKCCMDKKPDRVPDEVIEQNPKDVPFAIFVDVNSPITPNVPIDNKPWFWM